ncbi:MAG: YraN family protein [Spirochaetaceae bacterium]|jgi:putative endonuclease|nr:YraN family protein [Spirochaetaceae bacterium]
MTGKENGAPLHTSGLGKQGEREAEEFLKNAGMEILARNFRPERKSHSKGGEIDLIALDGAAIVFVEVKSWSRYGIENLELSISAKKQRRIIETAKFFLSKYREYIGMTVRFDVVFINRDCPPTHLVSAFSESV